MSPRPSRAQHVTVRLPNATADLTARVDAADDDVLTLVLTQPPAEGVEGLRDEPAIVEYTTPRGIYYLHGAIDGQGDAPEVVRVRRDGNDDVVQRRDFVRVDAVVPIQVTIKDPVRGVAHTTTLNLSGGGLLLSDPLGIPYGAVIDIDIELAPGSAPVRARGRVVREEREDEKGVRIESISREDRERLIRHVTERERHALRMARREG